MPATAEPPVTQQETAKVESQPQQSFSERMAAAREAASREGAVQEPATKQEKPQPESKSQSTKEKLPEAKVVETEKKEVVELKEPPKKEESKLSEALNKIKEGVIEEKKPEAKIEEKPDLSKMTKEQRESYTFRKLKEEADQAKALREELDGLKGKLNGTDIDALKKELDDIRKIAEERKQKLAAHDVTQTDKYQKEVAEPLGRILKELQDRSKKFGFVWSDFVDAVEKPDQDERELALSKVLASAETEIPNLTTLSILSSVNEYLQRQQFGDALIKNSIPAMEAMKREEAQKAEQAKKHEESEFGRISGIVFDHIVSDETLEAMPFLKTEDGKLDETKAEQIRNAAAYGDTPHHIRALQAYSTELLPMALEENKSLREKLAEREERISQLSGLSPSTKEAATEIKSSDDDGNLTFAEKVAKLQREQSMMR